jgi:hypothetical protein
MLRFQWNALNVGDQVLVHDDHDHYGAPLVEGIVTIVQPQTGANDVAIRISGASGVIHPRRSAVHLIEFGPRDTCWRCQALGEATAA